MQHAPRITIVLAALAILIFSWFAPLDDAASERVDDGLKRALVTYGTARLLYGIVSVAQGTQVSVTPAGVGTTIAPGQFFAPAAELLKQFSDLMLLVCVSFGIQKLLILIGGNWVISLALTAAAIGWVALYFKEVATPAWHTKALIVLLLVRFAVPLTVLGADLIFQSILHKEYQTSQAAIESVTGDSATVSPPEVPEAAEPAEASGAESPGVVAKLKGWVKKKAEAVATRYERLKDAVARSIKHMVTLMAVFVLQTIILPLLLLFGLYSFVRVSLQLPLPRNPLLKT